MRRLDPYFQRLIKRFYVKTRLLSMPAVRQAQKSVAVDGAHPYYRRSYKSEEANYWLPVPVWIEHDFRRTSSPKGLDIGCAYGTLSVYCRIKLNADMYCIDFIDAFMRPALREKYNLHFEIHNIELQPLPWEGPFDLILMTEVLEHLNFHPLPTLKKIHSVLAPGGRFYLTTPDAEEWGMDGNLYSSVDDIPAVDPGARIRDQHIYLYSKAELQELARAAGFKILRWTTSPGVQYRHHALTLGK
jgi:SAM-dependent methyltransferase